MTAVRTLRRGALPRAVLLAVIAALVPLPVAAGGKDVSTKASETPPSISAVLARELALTTVPTGGLDSSSTSRVPLSKAIARDLAPARSTTLKRSAQTSPGADSPTFFKTTTGAVVLAVMVVGVGYAIYSAQHDRIHSPGKE